MRSIHIVVAALGLVASLVSPPPAQAAATAGDTDDFTGGAPAGVVINEFGPSGPGGSTDEFLELHNTNNQWVALDGWNLRVCLAPALTVGLLTFGENDVIAPGGHLLLTPANSTELTPDYIYASSVPDDGGWLLSHWQSGQSDGVGVHQGLTCTEGNPAPQCDWVAGESVARNEQGTDTDDNAADFTCQPRTPGF